MSLYDSELLNIALLLREIGITNNQIAKLHNFGPTETRELTTIESTLKRIQDSQGKEIKGKRTAYFGRLRHMGTLIGNNRNRQVTTPGFLDNAIIEAIEYSKRNENKENNKSTTIASGIKAKKTEYVDATSTIISHKASENNAPILGKILREIMEPYYQENFVNPGERFIAWYLRNIYKRTQVQTRDDITDGPNDKCIDAIIVDDEQQQIIIIQGKFYDGTRVDSSALKEILFAWMQLQNLDSLQQGANTRLKMKLEGVRSAISDNYEIIFELVTTGNLAQEVKRDISRFEDFLENITHPTMSFALVDEGVIKTRISADISISHTIKLDAGKFIEMSIANTKTIIAAVSLSECIKIPGIHDGSLFRKNVRQSLGLTNKVNKGLKQTITGNQSEYLFFYHNGITALCDEMSLDNNHTSLTLKGLSVVNGCQSLSTILACSERSRNAVDSYVMFRFCEINDQELGEKISTNTNSQSPVKARDLRSNDKRVINLKAEYELRYPHGYFLTKRGEARPANKLAEETIDLSDLCKWITSWHSQRPNIAYSESRIFDENFDKLIREDYSPEDMFALKKWAFLIDGVFSSERLGLHPALQAASGFTRYYLLFSISYIISVASNHIDRSPIPSKTLGATQYSDLLLRLLARCLNKALDIASTEHNQRLFNPLNWFKSMDAISKTKAAIDMAFEFMDDDNDNARMLKQAITLPPDNFIGILTTEQ